VETSLFIIGRDLPQKTDRRKKLITKEVMEQVLRAFDEGEISFNRRSKDTQQMFICGNDRCYGNEEVWKALMNKIAGSNCEAAKILMDIGTVRSYPFDSLRRMYGLTVKETADLLEISEETAEKMCSGEISPTISTRMKFADRTGFWNRENGEPARILLKYGTPYYHEDIYKKHVMSEEMGKYLLDLSGTDGKSVVFCGCSSSGKTTVIRSLYGDFYRGDIDILPMQIYDMQQKGKTIELSAGNAFSAFHRLVTLALMRFPEKTPNEIDTHILKHVSVFVNCVRLKTEYGPRYFVNDITVPVMDKEGKVRFDPVFKLKFEESDQELKDPVWEKFI